MASIRKRSDTTYQITVSSGYDADNKKIRHQKTITLDQKLTPAKLEKELQRQATLFEDEVKKGTHLDGGKITLSEFIEKWLQDYADKNLQPKTLHEYRALLDRILPALGHQKIGQLQPHHLIQFYNNLGEPGIRRDCKYIALSTLSEKVKESGMMLKDIAKLAEIHPGTLREVLKGSPTIKAADISKALNIKMDSVFKLKDQPQPLSSNTINHYHRFLSSVLTTAVQWQVILSNPAERVKPPKIDKHEADSYDEDIAEKVLKLLESEPIKYRAMVALTIFAGVRRGELCGLEWPDVDLKVGMLRVRQASQYIPGQGTFTKDTKNESSYRVISLPGVSVKMLKAYKAWQTAEKLKCGDSWVKEWDKQQRLFTQWNGKPIYPGTVSAWFREFRDRHNLPALSFHGLSYQNLNKIQTF